MALRDRIRTMGFGLPDMGKLTDEFNAKFGELRDRLDTIIERLDTLIAETRTQRGAP